MLALLDHLIEAVLVAARVDLRQRETRFGIHAERRERVRRRRGGDVGDLLG